MLLWKHESIRRNGRMARLFLASARKEVVSFTRRLLYFQKKFSRCPPNMTIYLQALILIPSFQQYEKRSETLMQYVRYIKDSILQSGPVA